MKGKVIHFDWLELVHTHLLAYMRTTDECNMALGRERDSQWSWTIRWGFSTQGSKRLFRSLHPDSRLNLQRRKPIISHYLWCQLWWFFYDSVIFLQSAISSTCLIRVYWNLLCEFHSYTWMSAADGLTFTGDGLKFTFDLSLPGKRASRKSPNPRKVRTKHMFTIIIIISVSAALTAPNPKHFLCGPLS